MKAKPLPEQDILLEYLCYEETTGKVTYRKKTGRCVLAGKEVDRIGNHGYLHINFFKVNYLLHRLIWRMMTGEDPGENEVDHIDTNRPNNSWSNLRLSKETGQRHNEGIRKNNKSGVKGVSWCKRSNRWIAQLMCKRKTTYAGSYCDIEEARLAIEQLREKIHGEFCNHG